MLRYCWRDGAGDLRARLGRLHGGADLLDAASPLGAQAIELEVAQDELEVGRGRGAAHLVDVDEAFAIRSVVSGVSVTCGSVLDDLGRQVQRVDQLALGLSWMDRDALDVHVRLVRRERLVDDLAELGAIERIGDVSLQVLAQIAMDAAADLFVRREADPDRPVRKIGMCCSKCRAMVMTMATPALSSAPSSVVPLAVTMSSPPLRPGRETAPATARPAVVGQDEVAAGIVAMDDRLDARRVECRRRVHVRQERDWSGAADFDVGRIVARTAP